MAAQSERTTKYIALRQAASLVLDGIAFAEKGLLRNPSKERERKLNRIIARLELEKADIKASLIALAKKTPGYSGPTKSQIEVIKNLTAEVEGLTRANLTASAAVGISSRILAMATDLADVSA